MVFNAVIACLNSMAIVLLAIVLLLVASVEICMLVAISINFAVFHLTSVR